MSERPGQREPAAQKPPAKKLPIPGETFLVSGRPAFLILPAERSRGPMSWVWYAPTLPAYPADEERWMFERLRNAGVAIAGIDVGESYGSPAGRKLFTALYDELTAKRGMASKPALLARSRGGLMHYNWAAENPSRVAGVAGIYPVCDLRSYPGLAKACGAYGMTEAELTAHLSEQNPVERVTPLAKARVPLFHIHGNQDKVVPLEPNSEELARRYKQAGGPVTLRIMEGRGHDMWPGWFQNEEMAEFLIRQSKG